MVKPTPNELIECILENLYPDTRALLNCAFVGRAWVYPSQRGLFHHIALDLPIPHIPSTDYYETHNEAFLQTTERLISSFDANPHLASYVRSLQLVKSRKLPEPAMGYQEPVYNATANIVHHLSNLHKVSLLLHWNDLSHSLKTSLTDMLRSCSITQLSLIQFHIPTFAEVASWLGRMPYLKILNVHLFCDNWDLPNPSFSELEDEVQRCPPRSIQLEQLQLTSDADLIPFAAWFQQDSCPFQVHNLQCSINNSITSELAFDMLKLRDIGSMVRELNLRSGVNGHFHLGYTPNIHSLKLEASQNDLVTPVPWIQDLFTPALNPDDLRECTNLKDKFPLRHLRINLTVMVLSCKKLTRSRQWDQWRLVDALLAKPEFALLETVQIIITTHVLVRLADPSKNAEPLKGKLPLLEASGKLNVSYKRPRSAVA